jgi:hypothetical protein
MAVTLAKASDNVATAGKTVNSIALVEGIKVPGSKSVFSIRLETWHTTPGSKSTEVRVVVRDQNGKFHGATNFRQNVMLDITNLINGTHSNRRNKK